MSSERSILIVGMKGKVYGVDRATGALVWTNPLPDSGGHEVCLAVGGGAVYASAYAGVVFCVDYLTGVTRWQMATTAIGRATLVLDDDCLVCAKGGYLDCFELAGSKRWSQPLKGAGAVRAALGFPGNVVQADEGRSDG